MKIKKDKDLTYFWSPEPKRTNKKRLPTAVARANNAAAQQRHRTRNKEKLVQLDAENTDLRHEVAALGAENAVLRKQNAALKVRTHFLEGQVAQLAPRAAFPLPPSPRRLAVPPDCPDAHLYLDLPDLPESLPMPILGS